MRPDHAVVAISENKEAVCRAILQDLPRWFGIPESLEEYAREAGKMPMVGVLHDGEPVGFISLREHNPYTCEAYVLGIKRAWHRHGLGRLMFDHVEADLRRRGFRLLTVKTVGGDNPGPEYSATRRFYEAIGFGPVELFPTLWSPDNPCLVMAKVL
jgi:ribosomal protein S18 acetylase RimI-like enzyme